jgi:pimeloyl-ACP methyl ester carboxylesterase
LSVIYKPYWSPKLHVWGYGFAGSKQLMLGYGHVLAHAGYAVILWDFDGHGANGTRLQRYELQQNLDVAQVLLEQPQVDPSRLALLGTRWVAAL